MARIQMRTTDEVKNLIEVHSEMNDLSVTDFMIKTALEKIEEDIDIKAYDRRMTSYKSDPVSFSPADTDVIMARVDAGEDIDDVMNALEQHRDVS